VEIARRLLFNLYALNCDDHGRNHAFLYDRATSRWVLSAAFDLTYAPGTLSRGLTIAGEVRPSAETLVSFLASVAIARTEVAQLCEQVLAATSRWTEFAGEAGVARPKAEEIDAALRQAVERIGRIL